MEKPLVAIHCITYNQVSYIAQCLDGFVMQKTTFPFVAIVHDDASTDGTVDVVRKYAEKYPDIILPIFETENQYSKNDGAIIRIMTQALNKVGAKYVAMCEGDDYWIDPEKLQKQVDFLEEHKDFSICFHNVKIWKQEEQALVDDFITRNVPEETTILDLANENYIHTPSVMYHYSENVQNSILEIGQQPVGDYIMHMLYAEQGKIKKMPEAMAVYRYGIGIWSNQEDEMIFKWSKVLISLMFYFRSNNEVYNKLAMALKNIIKSINREYNHVSKNYISIKNGCAYKIGRIIISPFHLLKNISNK